MPLDSNSTEEPQQQQESENAEQEEIVTPPQPEVIEEPVAPVPAPEDAEKKETTAVEGAEDEIKEEKETPPMMKFQEFRALPKLNLVRVFAFVQQRVFLQEPISTCFSFLLDWSPVSTHEEGDEEWTTESGCDLAAEIEAAPSLNQGAEVIPCESMFRNLTRQLQIKNLICLCEVDTDFFGLIDCITLEPEDQFNESNSKKCYLRLQVFQKHDKIPWQTDISTMLFTLIEQRSIKNSLFSIQKYMEILPTFNEPFASSQREAWANQLASALIQIRVQGKQSECRKKVLTALDIAQVLYDQQFVAYLKKTFLDDNGNNNNQASSTNGAQCGTPSGSAMPTGVVNSPVAGNNQQESSGGAGGRGESQSRSERPAAARDLNFQKSFTPRTGGFQQPSFQQRQPSQPAHESPQGATPHSGKSSMQKQQFGGGNSQHFQDRNKRQFFPRTTTTNNNNDSSSTYSHNTNASQTKPLNRKRPTYENRTKLEGVPSTTTPDATNQMPSAPFQSHKRFK